MTLACIPYFATQTTGFSVTIPNDANSYHVDSANLLLAGTITLPVYPTHGQTLSISSKYGVTTLTLVGNAIAPLTSLLANAVSWRGIYYSPTAIWLPY